MALTADFPVGRKEKILLCLHNRTLKTCVQWTSGSSKNIICGSTGSQESLGRQARGTKQEEVRGHSSPSGAWSQTATWSDTQGATMLTWSTSRPATQPDTRPASWSPSHRPSQQPVPGSPAPSQPQGLGTDPTLEPA